MKLLWRRILGCHGDCTFPFLPARALKKCVNYISVKRVPKAPNTELNICNTRRLEFPNIWIAFTVHNLSRIGAVPIAQSCVFFNGKIEKKLALFRWQFTFSQKTQSSLRQIWTAEAEGSAKSNWSPCWRLEGEKRKTHRGKSPSPSGSNCFCQT